jgi:hypothetical protein
MQDDRAWATAWRADGDPLHASSTKTLWLTAVGILHDITESRKLFETVEQIFEKADSPMIMVCEPPPL